MKRILLLSLVVLLLWMVMFSPWTSHYVNFWFMMSISALILIGMALFSQREHLREIFHFRASFIIVGIFSAVALYIIFMVGNFVAVRLFPFARGQINNIYDLRNQSIPLVIGVLVFLIGPAEEIFWRGYVQHVMAQRLGPVKGYLIAALLYASVHFWAFNFMLFMAALVCGLFWGLVFLRYRSLWPCILSHALWDLFIFVILPVR